MMHPQQHDDHRFVVEDQLLEVSRLYLVQLGVIVVEFEHLGGVRGKGHKIVEVLRIFDFLEKRSLHISGLFLYHSSLLSLELLLSGVLVLGPMSWLV